MIFAYFLLFSSHVLSDGFSSLSLFSRAEPRRGLGQLPVNISSVTSLLLFNTNECPYKEYSFIDNLRRQDRRYLKASAPDTPLE
jgi:hypothetical protein